MKKILVPVDFSLNATNAAEFACNLALFYGAEIWLYHSYEMPLITGEFPAPLYDVNDLQIAAEHELNELTNSLLKKIRSNVTIHIKAETNLLQTGLSSFCDAIRPDLVVIGLSGSNALTKLVVGSNTIRIIHELTYPVLVIPQKASFAPVRKIGFACDYKQIEATTPVALLQKIVTDFNATLYVLNVDNNDKNFTNELVEEVFVLKELLKDIKPVYESIEAESITEGINQFIAKEALDWITVIPKKHSMIQKIFSRSHSKDLLYHTVVPILCVHQ
jgi:nucleotide-binding universal stress UspA family protein